MKTAFNATRLAIAAFIIPYIFAFNNAMLFIDTQWYEVVQVVVSSFIGMLLIASGLMGYMFRDLKWPARLIGIVGGLCLIYPGLITDLIGIGVLVALVLLQMMGKKSPAKLA